jgi:hypothetical protein
MFSSFHGAGLGEDCGVARGKTHPTARIQHIKLTDAGYGFA